MGIIPGAVLSPGEIIEDAFGAGAVPGEKIAVRQVLRDHLLRQRQHERRVRIRPDRQPFGVKPVRQIVPARCTKQLACPSSAIPATA